MFKRIIGLSLLLATISGSALAQPIQIPKPTKGLMPSAASGKNLFEASCAKCHGSDLRGSNEGPPLIHRVYEPGHHGDASFQIAVKYGTRQHHWQFGDMRPVPGLTPDDVAHITAYVRAEQRKAGIR